jgi:hypothetical protein
MPDWTTIRQEEELLAELWKLETSNENDVEESPAT